MGALGCICIWVYRGVEVYGYRDVGCMRVYGCVCVFMGVYVCL